MKFDFSEWLNTCAFSHEDAAKVLEIPVALVEYYIVAQGTIPTARIKKAKEVLENRKKALQDAIVAQHTKVEKQTELFNELLICLNLEAEKRSGGVFWDNSHTKEYVTQWQKALDADIVGFCLKSMKIQTNFDDNKFQPHEKTQTKQMPVFYMIDLFYDFANQDEFSKFISMRPQYKEKRRKLAEKGINYVYDFNINNILNKVFN